MADIKLYEPILLRQEGYYANTPGDTGGETWEGIARNKFPAWKGWPVIDLYRPAGGFVSETQANALLKSVAQLQDLVDAFYKVSEWDTMNADQIQNQSVANFLVDWEVNCGEGAPIKHTQIILDITPQVINMGPRTLGGINANSTQAFFDQLQAARKQYYLDIIQVHPEYEKFQKTWLIRTASFQFIA